MTLRVNWNFISFLVRSYMPRSVLNSSGNFPGFPKRVSKFSSSIFDLVCFNAPTYSFNMKSRSWKSKNWKLFYKPSIITLASNCEPLDVLTHLKLYSNWTKIDPVRFILLTCLEIDLKLIFRQTHLARLHHKSYFCEKNIFFISCRPYLMLPTK